MLMEAGQTPQESPHRHLRLQSRPCHPPWTLKQPFTTTGGSVITDHLTMGPHILLGWAACHELVLQNLRHESEVCIIRWNGHIRRLSSVDPRTCRHLGEWPKRPRPPASLSLPACCSSGAPCDQLIEEDLELPSVQAPPKVDSSCTTAPSGSSLKDSGECKSASLLTFESSGMLVSLLQRNAQKYK